jgi:hypothetical protein
VNYRSLLFAERGISIAVASALAALSGCRASPDYVIAASGTVIGVELSQNPATQIPQAKLGYDRAELAFVPTNRGPKSPSDPSLSGADQVADVLMELRYSGMFSTSGGIYQRLAVGPNAVKQAGAAFLFAKSPEGALDPAAAREVKEAISTRFGTSAQESLQNVIERVRVRPDAAQLFERAARSFPEAFSTVYDTSRAAGASEEISFLAAKNAYVESAGRGPRMDEVIRVLEDVLSKEKP